MRLTRELGRLLDLPELAGYGLSALYHCDATGEVRMRRLLPLRDLPPPGVLSHPPELNLPPADFLRGLTGHYLQAALNEVLYSSLMAENRQRQTASPGRARGDVAGSGRALGDKAARNKRLENMKI